MKAAWIDALGPASKIRCTDLPDPVPGPTEVLVRVAASAVNHVDTFVRSGAYPTDLPFPFVIGRDLVGTVVDSGTAVTSVEPGDMVWTNSLGHDGRQGAAAELALVPAGRLYPLPGGVDPTEAVAALHPAATAHLGLLTHARLADGETVLVSGAAGNVGAAAVVLARRYGARVVATAGRGDLDYCRGLGADVALDYRDPDLQTRLYEAAPDGFDVQFDASGRQDPASAVDLAAWRGRILLLAGMDRRPVVPVGPLYTRDRSLIGFAISNATASELADAARAINPLLEAGALRAGRIETMPLSAAATAHERLEAGVPGGTRLVLVPGFGHDESRPKRQSEFT